MKLIRTFVSDSEADGIWSVKFENEDQSEFDKFFDRVLNVDWIYQFFDKNRADLFSGFFGKITINNAVLRTLEEARGFTTALYSLAKNGFSESMGLQYLFKPLNNYEYAISVHQKSKARVRGGWLRLYAIRLAKNCYVVTGGTIKLTQNMNRPHLLEQLKKLDKAKNFLQENYIDYPEDLKFLSE